MLVFLQFFFQKQLHVFYENFVTRDLINSLMKKNNVSYVTRNTICNGTRLIINESYYYIIKANYSKIRTVNSIMYKTRTDCDCG